MPSAQIGHYGKGDLAWQIAWAGVPIVEAADVSYDVKGAFEEAGSGLGLLKNTYYKQTDAPKGSGKISHAMLQRSDGGMLFYDLASGSRNLIQEFIPGTAVTSYTTSLPLTSVLQLRTNYNGAVLREYVDYTVNYATNTITLAQATNPTDTGLILTYVSLPDKGTNVIQNGGFEDPLGTTWIATGTGATINQTLASAYSGSYGLYVSPGSTGNGFKYALPFNVIAGHTYTIQFRAMAAGSPTQTWSVTPEYLLSGVLTPITTTGTIAISNTSTWSLFSVTFVAPASQLAQINFTLTAATTVEPLSVDDVKMFDTQQQAYPAIANNMMDVGLGQPFQFEIFGIRKADGSVVIRLQKCIIEQLGMKSGKNYATDVSFKFLDILTE